MLRSSSRKSTEGRRNDRAFDSLSPDSARFGDRSVGTDRDLPFPGAGGRSYICSRPQPQSISFVFLHVNLSDFARLAVPILVLLLMADGRLGAQTGSEGPRGYGQTGDEVAYDTAAREEIRDRAEEGLGLLEQPIDPTTYVVGPNDVLGVTIWATKTLQFEVPVTPDVKLLIPTVGEVDVRGMTLAEASRTVDRAVSRSYRVGSSVSLLKMRKFKVNVIGAVRYYGAVTATPSTRVSETLQLAGGVLQRGDQRRITIIRQNADGSTRSIDVDLLPFLTTGDLAANPYVKDGDIIRVGVVDPSRIVRLYGEVVQPGEFTWRSGDRISSILASGLGPTVSARLDSIEVVSFDDQGYVIQRTYHDWDTASMSVTQDRLLAVGDRIIVRRRTNIVAASQVVIAGEVNQPGVYVIDPGVTRLRDIFASAHGITPKGNLSEAVFVRRSAQGQPDAYFRTIQTIDPESRSPEQSEYYRTVLVGLARQGTIPIDVPAALSGTESENLLLEDDDSIWVPARVDYIRLSGKIKNPGDQTFRADYTFRDYIRAAGGYSWKADESETQVIKVGTGDRLPAEDEDEYLLEPGDAIFVPEEQPSTFWEDAATALTIVTQIMAIIIVVSDVTGSNNAAPAE